MSSIFKFRSVLIAFSFIIVGLFAFSSVASAQGNAGVSIKPAKVEQTLDAGDSTDYILSVTNNAPKEQLYYLFVRNIAGVSESGAPIFARTNDEVTGYEISDWVELGGTELLLGPNESGQIRVDINVPENATPGSHFGGVFVSADPPEIERSGAAVGYQVSNIVSIRVSGDVIEEASIRQFSTDKFLYGSQNVDFLMRLENHGNVLVRPYGPIQIRNMLGNKVASIPFNENQNAVFPNTIRNFEARWEGDELGFGRYEAVLSAGYGEDGARKTVSSTVRFWILPMNIIGPALGVLALVLLITFVIVRVYINRTVAKLSSSRRVVRRGKSKQGSSTTLLIAISLLTVTALFLIVMLALFA